MNGNSEKIVSQRMPDLIKDKLMDWIMDGTIGMGDKLNAVDIANTLGVSGMPVREALKSMEKSGIVRSIPYVGTRVVELEMTDIVQIYLMRKALEPLASYYACKNATDDRINRIEEIHFDIENIIQQEEPSAKRIFVLNRQLHFSIFEMSSMHYLINMISTLWDNLAFYKLIYGRRYTKDKESAEAMIREHKTYLEYLSARDAIGLRDMIRDSLDKHVKELKDSVNYEL